MTDPGRSGQEPPLVQQAGNALLWRGFAVWAEKLIFLVRLLILARLLVPEDFGLVAIGMTALAVMGRVTDFGLIPALIHKPAEHKAHLDTAWTLSLLRGLGVTAILFFSAPWIADLFHEPRATGIVRAMALVTLANAAASIEIARVTRTLRFRGLALIRLAAAVVNTVLSIYLAGSLGAWALVWGAVAGAVAYLVGSYLVAPYRPAFRLAGASTDQLLRFGRWIFLVGVLGVVLDALLRWLITTRLGMAELGLFFLATRLAFLPTQTVTSLLNEVAFPVYSQVQHDRSRMARAFRNMLVSNLLLLAPASMILVVLVPGLVDHLLGERWAGTTSVMQLLVVAALAGSLGECALPLLKGIGRPRQIAGLEAARVFILITAAWLLIEDYGLDGVGLAYVITSVLAQLPVVYVLRKAVDGPFSGLLPHFFAILAAATLGAAVSAALLGSVPGVPGIALAMLFGPLATLGAGLLLDRWFGLRLLQRLLEPFPQLQLIAPRVLRWRR